MFQSFSSILDQTISYKEQMNKWGSGFSIEDDKRSNKRGEVSKETGAASVEEVR